MPVLLFSLTMFASAALLFLVEPMLAKMMLPLLGGTPAVWNTCLVFFQAALLAGYLYAHGAQRWLGRRTQIALHCALVALPLLPIGLLPLHLHVGWNAPTEANPAPWVLGMLLTAVGAPFFLLASNTPVLQRWFAQSGHAHARDPYFLYAASNAGSLVGLLAYPILLEPTMRTSAQSALWSWGYVGFAALTVLCAVLVWRRPAEAEPLAETAGPVAAEHGNWRERLRWIALAFAPSSLMLGVTTVLTTDVPALPLFWVLPLALYLVSFVIVFAKRQLIAHRRVAQVLPVFLLIGLLPGLMKLRLPLAAMIVLYLAALFCAALYCHGELARSRPGIGRLTEFYLLMSVGGVLGGIFNSLIAPVTFHSALEFPLVLVLAALLRRPKIDTKKSGALVRDLLFPAVLGIAMAGAITLAMHLDYRPGWLVVVLFFAYSALACFSFHVRRLRFAAGMAALYAAGSLYTGPYGHILDTERNFFGVVRVSNDTTGRYRQLLHAGTVHGMQSLEPARSREPLAYYTRSGPAGQVFAAMNDRLRNAQVAMVGLGAGTMACLTTPGQTLTYYEIDPLVVKIAEDTQYFTFLEECAPRAKVVLGDARLELKKAPDGAYKLIALDAFSGDSIPVHLITREALALYLRKLTPDGVLLVHISSLYLNLEPIEGNLARDAGLECYANADTSVTEKEAAAGKATSTWIVMGRTHAELASLVDAKDSHWRRVAGDPRAHVWSDDYSNLLSAVRWR